MNPVTIRHGKSCLVLAFPHSSTWLPEAVQERLNRRGQLLTDTDWHLERLYAGLAPEATTITANFSRYLIDANRPPDGESLYPGRATTELVPRVDFDGALIWRREAGADADEIMHRLEEFHAPYHAALSAELERVRELHGVAVLLDCHSIRSRIPRLFAGVLPDLNLGTFDGLAAGSALEQAAMEVCQSSGFSSVLNGHFKGGWTTRHHGNPEAGIHALQMELAQSLYLETEAPPFSYSEGKAGRLREILRQLLAVLEQSAMQWVSEGVLQS